MPTDRQTDRQTDGQTDRHTDACQYAHCCCVMMMMMTGDDDRDSLIMIIIITQVSITYRACNVHVASVAVHAARQPVSAIHTGHIDI